ncbi:MAG TPA: ATP-binding protein [Polyangiaceae bacterium]
MQLPSYAVPLLRALPEAAVFVTSDGQLLAANAAARAALHLTDECPRDCHLTDVLGGSQENLPTTLKSWSRSSEPTPGAWRLHDQPEPVIFNAHGSVIEPGDPVTPALLLVRFQRRSEANPFVLLNQKLADLNDEVARRVQTEDALRRSEGALRERASEAESLNRTKDEFLATVSHELRTPLNAILGWSELLQRRASEPELAKGLSVIARNARAQAKLIDDVLDVSRVTTGKFALERRLCNLSAIVEDAVEIIRPSVAAKDLTLSVNLPAHKCTIFADPDRLRQAVWNLLSNALKFTPKGGQIQVELVCRASQVALTVRDTGVGIAPGFLPFVFERFKQADSTTTRRVGGLGLGLALVRHIVELHGGTVEAFSAGTNQGATFTVRLPLSTADFQPAARPTQQTPVGPLPTEQQTLHGLRVLVVDDEPDALDLLSALLAGAGAEVEGAGSVSEALRAVARKKPHVLVSDIGMPDEDGYSFIQRLHQLAPGGAPIPSVALTAYTRSEDRAKALTAGFTAHLGKPVDAAELVSTVANLARPA